jgi:transcriptional regulator with XRE-family HTH domain
MAKHSKRSKTCYNEANQVFCRKRWVSMSVNEKIKLIREAKNLTQEQVAEKLGMCVNSYGDIERGERDIKLSRLEKIAELFEMKASELLDLTDKTVLNINLNKKYKGDNKVNVYFSSDSELEKSRLIIELKDKELAMQQRENENLREQVLQLKEINTLLKKEV